MGSFREKTKVYDIISALLSSWKPSKKTIWKNITWNEYYLKFVEIKINIF